VNRDSSRLTSLKSCNILRAVLNILHKRHNIATISILEACIRIGLVEHFKFQGGELSIYRGREELSTYRGEEAFISHKEELIADQENPEKCCEIA